MANRSGSRRPIAGALAAAVTPLRSAGDALDEGAFGPMLSFLHAGGLDGVLALGTTGEGILLSVDERKRAAGLFLSARPPDLAVVVHCGAQTTRDTVELAADSAVAGADGVAVIAPPYYPFDPQELGEHFRAAASACEPLPFYVYEFAARSGYAVPVSLVERLREECPNLRGLKVSDSPLEAVRPYLSLGLDVFVGQEPLVQEAQKLGAAGAVSGLASAFPEVVAALARGDRQAHEKVISLREHLRELPFQAAMKTILRARGLPISSDVRAPFRRLSPAEREAALAALHEAVPGG